MARAGRNLGTQRQIRRWRGTRAGSYGIINRASDGKSGPRSPQIASFWAAFPRVRGREPRLCANLREIASSHAEPLRIRARSPQRTATKHPYLLWNLAPAAHRLNECALLPGPQLRSANCSRPFAVGSRTRHIRWLSFRTSGGPATTARLRPTGSLRCIVPATAVERHHRSGSTASLHASEVGSTSTTRLSIQSAGGSAASSARCSMCAMAQSSQRR